MSLQVFPRSAVRLAAASRRAAGRSVKASAASTCSFCTTSSAKGKGRASSSSRENARLSSLIGLYHSARSSPAVHDTQALTQYIDHKLLSAASAEPLDTTALLARGQQERDEANGHRALVFSDGHTDPYAYMDAPIVYDGGPAKRKGFSSGLLEDIEAERRGTADLIPPGEGGVWKPFHYTATNKERRRGKQLLDALVGTVDGQHAGPELVQEAYEAFKKESK